MAEPITPNQGAGVIQSESRRRLQSIPFVANTIQTIDLPRDTVCKRLHLRMAGWFTVTYTSGAPTADQTGMNRILNRIEVNVNGSDTIKSIDPYLTQRMAMLLNGEVGERAFTVTGATTTPTTTFAATEATASAPFTYDATGQYNVANEEWMVRFDLDQIAYEFGREAALLNLKGVSSAELRLAFGDMTSLLATAAAPITVTYGNNTLTFYPSIVEAQNIPADQQFYYYIEKVKRVQFSAETRDGAVDMPRGSLLMGVSMLARDGDATKHLSDTCIRDLKLILNGTRIIASTNWGELQAMNRSRWGIRTPKASSIHEFRGFNWLNMINAGDIRSALPTSQAAGIDQVQLLVTTSPSSGTDSATYTNPVELTIQTHELALAPSRK